MGITRDQMAVVARLWGLALVLCVLCGASPEVISLQEAGQSKLPGVSGGADGDRMQAVKESVTDAVAKVGAQTAQEAAEQAAQKLLKTPSKQELIAERKKLPMMDRIEAHVKAYLSSPRVQKLIQEEVRNYREENAAALALRMAQLEKPVTPEEAVRDAVEKQIKETMADSPDIKEKTEALENKAVDKEVKQVEAKVELKKKQAKAIENAAEAKLTSEETKVEKKASAAAEKVNVLTTAVSALSGDGKKQTLARISKAETEKKEADKKEAEFREEKEHLKQEEQAEEEAEEADAAKAIQTVVKDKVKQEVETKVQLQADQAADAKVKDIADNIKEGVEKAEQRAELLAKKKAMMDEITSKIKPNNVDEDRYWQRRRRFAAEKQRVTGELDAWKSPKKAKKEEAGQQALKADLQKKLTPRLLNAVAKAALETTEENEDEDDDEDEDGDEESEVDVLDSQKEEAEALAEETQGRIEDALQRIAASRATVKSATNVAEAKVARASMERASKELKKDEDKKQIQVEKVDELQKQEN